MVVPVEQVNNVLDSDSPVLEPDPERLNLIPNPILYNIITELYPSPSLFLPLF